MLLAALASTRPLPVALEHELRRRQRAGDDGRRIELDPLRRFDDSGLLLQRARHLSLALWRLQERLSRPTTSIDALHWRLHGALGPLAIADGLVRAALEQQTLPGEAHFLLAELALTVAAVDWVGVASGIDPERVRALVAEVLARHRGAPEGAASGPRPGARRLRPRRARGGTTVSWTLSPKVSLRNDRVSDADADRQQQTAAEILRRLADQPGLVLADEVGMGKTYVALAVATSVLEATRRKRPVVVMVPPAVAEKWPTEWAVFAERCLPAGHGLRASRHRSGGAAISSSCSTTRQQPDRT